MITRQACFRILGFVASLAFVTLTALPAAASLDEGDACGGGDQLAEPVLICGRNTIEAEKPSVVRVEIPADTSIGKPEFGSDDVIVLGGGDAMSGFVLTQDVDGYDGLTLAGLRVGGWTFLDSVGRNDGSDERYEVPAGIYLLHILPGGSPVQIHLRFEGLPGQLHLDATRPARAEITSGTPSVQAGGEYWGGANGVLNTEGIALQVVRLTYGDPGVFGGRFESCLYPGGETATGVLAFGPICPESSQRLAHTLASVGGGVTFVLSPAPLEPGRYGLGFNMHHVGRPSGIVQTQLWLDLG